MKVMSDITEDQPKNIATIPGGKAIVTLKDDGSLDWYLNYGPSTKAQSEIRRRNENDRKRKLQKENDALRLKEEKELEKLEEAKVIQLPLWPDGARGVPNSSLRGSLFAAIQGRYAKYVKNLILHDTGSLKITYTGMRLTQSDLDVWGYALHLARKQNLGYKVFFTERAFLKGLGRATGKSQYAWLKSALSRMGATTVSITHNESTYMGSLIQESYKDDATGRYCVVINPKIARLFDAGYTLLDWEQRKIIAKKPLAQWLHGYISSHKNWVPHKVETIKNYSGSETREIRFFKKSLKEALDLLLKNSMISGYFIDKDNMLHVDIV